MLVVVLLVDRFLIVPPISLISSSCITVKDVNLSLVGNEDQINSTLTWLNAASNKSNISWTTQVLGLNEFKFDIGESYLGLGNKKWDLNKNAFIYINNSTAKIDRLKLKYENQF